MIAIFSTKWLEDTTFGVMDWIDGLGGEAVRLNHEQLPQWELVLHPTKEPGAAYLQLAEQKLNLSKVRVVWYRSKSVVQPPQVPNLDDKKLTQTVKRHMDREWEGTVTSLYESLSHAKWYAHPKQAMVNKFHVLQRARRGGLTIPPTLVTNSKQQLQNFYEQHGDLIVKCITNADGFQKNDLTYTLFTNPFHPDHMAALPDLFFPLLVQKKIEKAWEIRTFYLDGELTSMAIFSQNNPNTQVDFRRYDHTNPNRTIPYALNTGLTANIKNLMTSLHLDTGSLDFIRGADGKTYFLEVNPLGQFGMVSGPCNAFLEKKMATRLMARDHLS